MEPKSSVYFKLRTLCYVKQCVIMYLLIYCFSIHKDVEQLIQAALAKYSADRIGKFDFALENVGGVVVQDKCSETFSPSLATVSLFGIPLFHVTSSPRAIIQVREEGNR